MNITMAMLDTFPAGITLDRARLGATIDAVQACAEACTACADACLSEPMVAELTTCIRTTLDCADICTATARVLSRHTGYDANITRSLLQACVMACHVCGAICGIHAGRHAHCRICAEACLAGEQACRTLFETMR